MGEALLEISVYSIIFIKSIIFIRTTSTEPTGENHSYNKLTTIKEHNNKYLERASSLRLRAPSTDQVFLFQIIQNKNQPSCYRYKYTVKMLTIESWCKKPSNNSKLLIFQESTYLSGYWKIETLKLKKLIKNRMHKSIAIVSYIVGRI